MGNQITPGTLTRSQTVPRAHGPAHKPEFQIQHPAGPGIFATQPNLQILPNFAENILTSIKTPSKFHRGIGSPNTFRKFS